LVGFVACFCTLSPIPCHISINLFHNSPYVSRSSLTLWWRFATCFVISFVNLLNNLAFI
jgi:hypothetical protein